MKTIDLVVEKTKNGVWGRINYKKNLMVEEAKTVQQLQKKFKTLLVDFYDLQESDIEFLISYDIAMVFEEKNFLNISAIAQLANMNSSLLRQYASGIKYPSTEKTEEIEHIIRKIGQELSKIKLSSKASSKKVIVPKRSRSKN